MLQLSLTLCVLIETLWNVKLETEIQKENEEKVLIETLWNVKTEEAAPIEYTTGININIVECKDRTSGRNM